MSIDGGLNQIFQQHMPHVHWQRFEPAGDLGAGVPDLNGCVNGCEFWIELKRAKGWRVEIQPAQVGWSERRTRRGGRIFLACRRLAPASIRRAFADELWLMKPQAIRFLCLGGLDTLPKSLLIAKYDGGPTAWPWVKIERILCARK